MRGSTAYDSDIRENECVQLYSPRRSNYIDRMMSFLLLECWKAVHSHRRWNNQCWSSKWLVASSMYTYVDSFHWLHTTVYREALISFSCSSGWPVRHSRCYPDRLLSFTQTDVSKVFEFSAVAYESVIIHRQNQGHPPISIVWRTWHRRVVWIPSRLSMSLKRWTLIDNSSIHRSTRYARRSTMERPV